MNASSAPSEARHLRICHKRADQQQPEAELSAPTPSLCKRKMPSWVKFLIAQEQS